MSDLCPGYHAIRGSDVQRDSVYLELVDTTTGDEVAEIFHSDVTQTMMLTLFREDLPLPVVEHFIARAKRDLPYLPEEAA